MIYEVITTDQANADLRGVTIIRVIYAGRDVDKELRNYTVM